MEEEKIACEVTCCREQSVLICTFIAQCDDYLKYVQDVVYMCCWLCSCPEM